MTQLRKRVTFLTLLIGGIIAFVLEISPTCRKQSIIQPLQHVQGDILDSLDGVYVYYNGSVSNVSGRNLSEDGYNLGLKYQCVEFVKRYYYEHFKHKMPDSYGHAKSFFKAGVEDGELNPDRGLTQFTQGSKTSPEVGDLLIFDGHRLNPYGHVAIVSQVEEDRVEMIQQNPGPTAPSREWISLTIDEGKISLDRSDCLGWLRKTSR
ncbi:MAG: CHAP domain-containing protein [Bacteroidetes bacterium]|nr:CHAP domain-containing protein [Bacteroidota bacterium]